MGCSIKVTVVLEYIDSIQKKIFLEYEIAIILPYMEKTFILTTQDRRRTLRFLFLTLEKQHID